MNDAVTSVVVSVNDEIVTTNEYLLDAPLVVRYDQYISIELYRIRYTLCNHTSDI